MPCLSGRENLPSDAVTRSVFTQELCPFICHSPPSCTELLSQRSALSQHHSHSQRRPWQSQYLTLSLVTAARVRLSQSGRLTWQWPCGCGDLGHNSRRQEGYCTLSVYKFSCRTLAMVLRKLQDNAGDTNLPSSLWLSGNIPGCVSECTRLFPLRKKPSNDNIQNFL